MLTRSLVLYGSKFMPADVFCGNEEAVFDGNNLL